MKNDNDTKKIIFRIIIFAVITFLALNAFWFSWRTIQYGKYSKGFTKTVFSEFFTPRYAFNDADGYEYYVKYPDYFTFTGNLSMNNPEHEAFEDQDICLFIWPKVFGQYEYGILIYDGGQEHQIYLDENGNAISPENKEIVQRHKDEIIDMFERADKQWDIK